jgi:hypothetical protein
MQLLLSKIIINKIAILPNKFEVFKHQITKSQNKAGSGF